MKKSSTDHKSGNLEEVFRHGFGDAEATPTGDLWSRIDRQLDQAQQMSTYKKRASLFRRLALLSALLLVLLGGAWFYTYQKAASTRLAALAEPTNAGPSVAAAHNAVPQPAAAIALPDAADASAPQPATSQPDAAANTSGNSASAAASANTAAAPGNRQADATQPALNGAATRKAKATRPAPTRQPYNTRAATFAPETRSARPAGALAVAPTRAASGSEAGNGQAPPASQSPAREPHQEPAHSSQLPAAGKTEPVVQTAGLPAPAPESGNIAPGPADAEQAQQAPEAVSPEPEPATGSELAAATPIPDLAPAKQGMSFSMWYAGYQFDQGLVASSDLPASSPSASAYRQAAQEFNELAKPASSYRVEARMGYWLHERWRLDAGVAYSRNRAITLSTFVIQNYVRNTGDGTMEMVGQTGIIEPVMNGFLPDSVGVLAGPEYETHYQYEYLALPVRLVYQSDAQGFHWFASAGFSTARLLNSQVRSTGPASANPLGTQAPALRKWNVAGLFSFGLGYQLGQSVSLQAGPDLSYSLNSLMSSEKAGVRQQNPYTLGLTGGITYTFR